jgi:hypothetical protein
LVISNPNGVKLVFNGGTNNGTSNTGLVCVGSTKVGTINTSGSIPLINYTDGTFESLN